MSRKVFPFLFVLIFIISQTGCLYGNIVDNKYTTTGVGNLTPVKSLIHYVGSPTYVWNGGYFANLTTNYLNLFNTNTNISRDGAGNMIFTDAVSGTKTLADLTVGSGGNVTGSGTLNQMARWTSSSTIGSATNTDAQVSAAVTASHAQNTDTALGVLGADLNMGGNSITNVNLVDGIDVSTLGTGNVTGGGAPTRLAYWDGATSLGDTNIYFDVPLGYYGIGTVTPATMLQIHDGSGANQLQLSYTAGSIYTNITSNHLGYLLLTPTGDRAVLSGNLSMNTHYINDVVNPSLSQDAATKNYVDTAVAGVGGGNVTNPLSDDVQFGIGNNYTSSLLWETADANANAMVIALPDGGATDVPVLVIGDQSVINKDLSFFNGVTAPQIAVLSADESAYLRLRATSVYSMGDFSIGAISGAGVVSIVARANFSQYLTFSPTASNVPTLYGTGAYLRVGDAAVTSHSLASEDDLMVSGKLEVNDTVYFDGAAEVHNYIHIVTSGQGLYGTYTNSGYTFIKAKDDSVGWAEIARLQSGTDPYFGIGRDDTGVSLNTVTDMLILQAGAGTNNEAVGQGLGTSWKLGNSASEVEERGSIDLVSTNATNGAEASKFNFSVMSGGSIVNPSLSLSANTTATQLTVPADLYIDTGASKTLVLTQPVYDDMMVDMSNVKTPASNAPVWTAYKSTEVPAFSKTATNTLYFTAQVPHRYKEGTNLEFHIHLAYPDNGAGNSIWYFTYSWANRDANYPAASNSGNVIIASPATTDRHQLAELVASISGTGKTVSSVLLCSISRIGGDGSDDYDNVIYLTSSDFHYQVDTMGSRTGTAK